MRSGPTILADAKERSQLFPVGARAVENVPGLLALSTDQVKIRP